MNMPSSLKLVNGIEIPHIGFGTYPMKGDELNGAIRAAYNSGYRLFDTSDNYYNEIDLGESISKLYNEGIAKRENLFLVTKVSDELYPIGSVGAGLNRGVYFWKNSPLMQSSTAVRDIVRKKLENSLSALKTDHLDLYLLHWPYPDYFIEIWNEIESIYEEKIVKAIGVCNCRERHLSLLKKNCSIMPMVNQFETSPLNTKESLVQYCNTNDIQIMVYSPLMSLKHKTYKEYRNFLSAASQKYSKTPSQILLRFDIQRGCVPIPKSSNPERIRQNIDIFDFSLADKDMEALYTFNVDLQTLPESKACPGL